MGKNKIVNTVTFNGHPVIGDNMTFTYHERYLEQNQQLLDNTIARHNKVMAVRMDLRYPADYTEEAGNEHFSHAMRTYTRDLSRAGLDPQYVARREQKTSEHPHYHVDLLVDGSKVQRYQPLIDNMATHWGNALSISDDEAKNMVNPCNKNKHGNSHQNGIMIRRGEDDFSQKYDEVFKQMSYTAKSEEDDITPSNVKKVFYSQYKRDKSRPKK